MHRKLERIFIVWIRNIQISIQNIRCIKIRKWILTRRICLNYKFYLTIRNSIPDQYFLKIQDPFHPFGIIPRWAIPDQFFSFQVLFALKNPNFIMNLLWKFASWFKCLICTVLYFFCSVVSREAETSIHATDSQWSVFVSKMIQWLKPKGAYNNNQ